MDAGGAGFAGRGVAGHEGGLFPRDSSLPTWHRNVAGPGEVRSMSPVGPPVSEEGAEAQVREEIFLGITALRKLRVAKAYRPKHLDSRIRSERMRMEVRLLREARAIGVRTPFVLDVDMEEGSFIMEKIEGRTLTDLLLDPGITADLRSRVMEELGRALGRLHASGISHGDLTGSNVMWTGNQVVLIDLSMGSRTPELEEMGIDLHLMEEDLNTLAQDANGLYDRLLSGYREGNAGTAVQVIERSREIKGRVRYS